MPFGERGDTAVQRDRLRLVQTKAIAGTIPQYQRMVVGEFPEKISEDRGDTRKVILAIVDGEDLSQWLFGSMS
jgi:hypothetical protein